MANRQRAEARRKAQAKAARTGEDGGSKMGIWIGLAAVIALVVGIVVFASGGDDSSADPSDTTADSSGLASLPVSQPVTITGESLQAFDSAVSPDPAIGLDAPLLSGLNFSDETIALDPAVDGELFLGEGQLRTALHLAVLVLAVLRGLVRPADGLLHVVLPHDCHIGPVWSVTPMTERSGRM